MVADVTRSDHIGSISHVGPHRHGWLSQIHKHCCRWPNNGIQGFKSGVSLTEKKKSVPVPVFPKKPAGTPCAQPWLVAVGGWWLAAVGGWQLATGGWWRLVVVGGGWWLAVGGWRRLAVVGSWRLVSAGGWRRLVAGGWWRLVVGGWWRLAVDGSWRLAVGGPLGRSLRAVLSKKKKISSLKDPPGSNAHRIMPYPAKKNAGNALVKFPLWALFLNPSPLHWRLIWAAALPLTVCQENCKMQKYPARNPLACPIFGFGHLGATTRTHMGSATSQ